MLELAIEAGRKYTNTFAFARRSLSEHFSPVLGSTAFIMLPIIVRLSDPSPFIRWIDFCENFGQNSETQKITSRVLYRDSLRRLGGGNLSMNFASHGMNMNIRRILIYLLNALMMICCSPPLIAPKPSPNE